MRASSRSARLGFLLTSLLFGGVLAATALLHYLSTDTSARMLTQAQAADLLFSARRGLRLAGSLEPSVLSEFFQDAREAGLRYVAVLSRDDGVVSSAGEAEGELQNLPRPCLCMGPEAEVEAQAVPGSERLRVVARLVAGPGGAGRMGPGWRHGPNRPEWGEFRLVLEFLPLEAHRIQDRALWLLLVGLGSAAVLLGAALLFWRLSRRAEAITVQLARDGQLKALGEMSAVLGHELRNPLTALKGHAQLLLEKLPPDHPGRLGAETVVREAQRLQDLTGQVLDFARTGRLECRPEDPLKVVRAAVETHGGGRVQVVAPGSLPAWPLDRSRLEQALANLLDNAVQASPPGAGIDLEVALEGAELVLRVRDRGAGIPPGQEQQIFEPFHTTRTRGTGLGLSVARRIVEGHGGSLRAANHPQGGAVFTLRLPRTPCAEPGGGAAG